MNTSGVPETRMARAGLALAEWSQSWFPDPAVVAFLGVVVVFRAKDNPVVCRLTP